MTTQSRTTLHRGYLRATCLILALFDQNAIQQANASCTNPLLPGCVCQLGLCANADDLLNPFTGEVCTLLSDCVCNTGTGNCYTTLSPSPSEAPSLSAVPSVSSKPSQSLQPSPTNGLGLCALINPCSCLLNQCQNTLDLGITAAGVCVTASDCTCDMLTGICDNASEVPSAGPSVSLVPSTSDAPSAKPSVSMAPSTSVQPSPSAGLLNVDLCTDLIDPNVPLLGTIGCICLSGVVLPGGGTGSRCNVATATLGDAVDTEVCALNSDCVCNTGTGQCESITTAPSISAAPSLSGEPSSNPSSSLVPSTSGRPSLTGGGFCALINPCDCLAGSCQNVLYAGISAAGVCVSAADCACNSFTGVCDTVSVSPSSSPSTSLSPSTSSIPSKSSFPSLSGGPSSSSLPSVSSHPSLSILPSVSSSPSSSISPSQSTSPSLSNVPSTSTKPTVSVSPSTSTSPSITQVPSLSANPSLSSNPSISAHPSLSTNPSTSQNPSISTLPTISQLPSSSPSAPPSVSRIPSALPSQIPSLSQQPSPSPSDHPSLSPSVSPSISLNPTSSPSASPSTSHSPSDFPTSSPSGYPSRDCDAPTNGCGFGMWNYYVCECQCISPYCPDATGACYQTYSCPVDNYFQGCTHDCPWYADTVSGSCVQGDTVPSGVSQVYMTQSRCCEAEFQGSVSICIAGTGAVVNYWYPDWSYGSGSCLDDGLQPDYMNSDMEYWLFDNPYDCCMKYFGWEQDSCVSISIQGSIDYSPPPSSSNVVMNYSCRICFSDCPAILDNMDAALPIIASAIFSGVCNGNCKEGDNILFESLCGQDINVELPFSTNRRLQQVPVARRAQSTALPCLDFTIKLTAQSESEAVILYNHLYLLLGTSPTQYDTLQAIQSYIQMTAITSLPALSSVVIDGYSHISYSIIGLSPIYYPDWGHSETCKNDGGEPAYMTSQYFSNSLEECCDKYYYWKKNECMNEANSVVISVTACTNTSSNSSTTLYSNSAGRYYPDWTNGNKCISDGNEPDYMRAWPDAWIFDNVKDCCAQHFQWDADSCMSYASPAADPCTTQVVTPCPSNGTLVIGTQNTYGTYYPDWIGGKYCVSDGNAPQYMKNWPYTHPTGWFFNTLEDCCHQHFSWTLSKCLGYSDSAPCPTSTVVTATTATTATMTTTTAASAYRWYVDWSIYRCVQSCESSTDPQCGGAANYWEETYSTSAECCAKHLSYQSECTP